MCLHGHDQPLAHLVEQLRNLDTPERLLLLPEALSRYALPPPTARPRAPAARGLPPIRCWPTWPTSAPTSMR